MKSSAERSDDRAAGQAAAPVVDLDKKIDLTALDLTAPLRHFHRTLKGRGLRSGPLANPDRTRLV
jgi:hypothetical protein